MLPGGIGAEDEGRRCSMSLVPRIDPWGGILVGERGVVQERLECLSELQGRGAEPCRRGFGPLQAAR